MYDNLDLSRKKLTPIRKIIRDRMTESNKVPQFNVSMKVCIDQILEIRAKYDIKPSVTACLTKCCSKAILDHPKVNAYFLGDEIGYISNINIGIAAAGKNGLIVPVIKDVDKKSIEQVGIEIKTMVDKIKNNKVMPDDMNDGTFTISNLGMYGVSQFTALLNCPQVAIMSIGGIYIDRNYSENGAENKYINVNVAADHRALDGATVAEFLVSFKRYCEGIGAWV